MTPPVAVKPLAGLPAGSRRICEEFCQWLRDGGYSDSTVYLYGRAARLALGRLAEADLSLDPQDDPSATLRGGLDGVRESLAAHYESEATRRTYAKGLAKLAEYVRMRCNEPTPEKQVNWDYYLDPLPARLATGVRAYVVHRQRNWLSAERCRATCTLLSHVTLSLRWMVKRTGLTGIEHLTPALWLDYVDARLGVGIRPTTLNRELRDLQHLLRFLAEEGQEVCHRMLRMKPLKTGRRPPRDVPVHQLRQLLRQVEVGVAPDGGGDHRQALLDRAWVLLMLHSGLRSGELRRLRLSDLDLDARQARIEQSKGLTDRVVCLSAETVAAICAYLAVRGPAASDHVFVYRHWPLSSTYCGKRLRTLGSRCGVRVTPHQLRCSFATLLLNAGASVLTVQALLGHKHVDTTLRYARVYDSTVAADYVRAAHETDLRLGLSQDTYIPPLSNEHRHACFSAVVLPSHSYSASASLTGQLMFMCNSPPSCLA
jgi:site-specific recombinase XerD